MIGECAVPAELFFSSQANTLTAARSLPPNPNLHCSALHGIILTSWSIVGIVGGLTFTAIFKNQVAYYGSKKSPYVYDINFWTICAFISLV